MSAFGWISGLRLYVRARWGRGDVDVSVPGFRTAILIRAGSSDRDALRQVFANREYAERYPFAPRVILDLGANCGCATAWFAATYPSSRIIAVEPDVENAKRLATNANRYPGRVRVLRSAIWTHAARLTIANPTASAWSYRVREAGTDESWFDATTIPRLVKAPELIDIAKIDIEGAERELFSHESVDDWLPRTNLVFVETHDRHAPGSSDAVLRAADRHGFHVSQRGENLVLRHSRVGLARA